VAVEESLYVPRAEACVEVFAVIVLRPNEGAIEESVAIATVREADVAEPPTVAVHTTVPLSEPLAVGVPESRPDELSDKPACRVNVPSAYV
jgi:hypothetical protein